jgi:oligosaccharide repeat unit polymerase
VGIAIVYAFLSTGRTYFLLLLSMLGAGLIIQRKARVLRTVLWSTLAFGVIFSTLGYLREKTAGTGTDLFSNMALEMKSYFLGGICGLNAFYQDHEPWALGTYTFRGVLAVLNKIDGNIPVHRLVLEFRDVPFTTNVYTVFRPYFQDFGFMGIILSQFVFGMLHAHAYLRARRKELIWVFVYAIMIYPLIMQFFQDQYMSLLSVWAQAILLLGLVRLLTMTRDPIAGAGGPGTTWVPPEGEGEADA